MSSEGGHENSTMPSSSSSVLRAAAPIFVPSSSLVVNTSTTIGSGSPPGLGPNNAQSNRNRRSGPKSQHQQTKGKKSQRQRRGRQRRRQEKDGSMSKSDSNLQNNLNDGQELDSSTNDNQCRSNTQDRSSQSEAKGGRKRRQRNRGRDPRSKNITTAKSDPARNRKGYRNNSGFRHEDSSNDDDSEVRNELELSSSFAFPALMEDSTRTHEDRNKLQPTIWGSVTGVKELREGQLQREINSKKEHEALEKREAEMWRNGLDRLTTRDRILKRTSHRQEFLSWDEEPDDEVEREISVAIGIKSARSTFHIASGGSGVIDSERRTFNIDRLRDRWWAAVADQQRRLEQQQTEELEQQQQQQIESSPEILNIDENMQLNYIGGNIEVQGIGTDGTKSQDSEPYSPDVQKRDHILPLRHEVRSQLELLDVFIERNDEQGLRDMIEVAWKNMNATMPIFSHSVPGNSNSRLRANATQSFDGLNEEKAEESGVNLVEHAISVLIRRNHPNLLRTVLSITRGNVPLNSTPLIEAARFGHEECASIILSKQEKGSMMLFLADVDGNTALHYCCGESGKKDMLRTLLKQVGGNTKRQRQQLLKLVTTRNKNMQTALHVACGSGRNDLVELFLTTCKSSVLFKLLSIEDTKLETPLLCAVSNNSCDVVLSLLMWRRNHDHQHQKQPEIDSISGYQDIDDLDPNQISKTRKGKITACPLFWAAKSGNLEMIDLLIQFEDQSGTLYQATDALWTLLQADIPNDTKLKGGNMLIFAGANPFQELPHLGSANIEKETSISIAAKTSSVDVLRSIILTAIQIVEKRQLDRRRNPVLQKQPDAFFRTLECREDCEAEKAISDALVETLVRAYTHRRYSDFSKAVVLYENIRKLRDEYLMRLQNRLRFGQVTSSANESKNWCLLATYEHFANVVMDERSTPKSLDFDRSVFREASLSLLKLAWTSDEVSLGECFCPWIRNHSKEDLTSTRLLSNDRLTLIADDGSRFLVHASIVSKKSEKIGSGLRFARMKGDDDSVGEISLEVNTAPDFCKLMIQHMYHGSISFGWPDFDDTEMCRYLLELMIVAEEFLIPSLVQEIEMRLLSSTPTKCFCWDCCQACRYPTPDQRTTDGQCLFWINSGSRLINKDTAMDVLSLTDYIGGLDYTICMVQSSLDFHVREEKILAIYNGEVADQNSWRVENALSLLRNASILTILKEFAHVVKSHDFCLTAEGDQRDEYQKHAILQICLDELRNNTTMTTALIS